LENMVIFLENGSLKIFSRNALFFAKWTEPKTYNIKYLLKQVIIASLF